MNNSIRIKIHQENNACVISAIVLVIGALALAGEYKDSDFVSPAVIILFICCSAAVNIFVGHPTTVTADCRKIKYKHYFKEHEIDLCDVELIYPEFYSVYAGRGGSRQRICLTIVLKNGDEIELNDEAYPNKILNNSLENKQTDIPLLKLYSFLKDRNCIKV